MVRPLEDLSKTTNENIFNTILQEKKLETAIGKRAQHSFRKIKESTFDCADTGCPYSKNIYPEYFNMKP